MELIYTVPVIRYMFVIATSVTFWVVVVYDRNCVERLVNVSGVMNYESESERLLISLIIKVLFHELDVLSVISTLISFQELNKGIESITNTNV